jgi:hypothetical protein
VAALLLLLRRAPGLLFQFLAAVDGLAVLAIAVLIEAIARRVRRAWVGLCPLIVAVAASRLIVGLTRRAAVDVRGEQGRALCRVAVAVAVRVAELIPIAVSVHLIPHLLRRAGVGAGVGVIAVQLGRGLLQAIRGGLAAGHQRGGVAITVAVRAGRALALHLRVGVIH